MLTREIIAMFALATYFSGVSFAQVSDVETGPGQEETAETKSSEKREKRIKSVICGSYGCDKILKTSCDGGEYKILDQRTTNKYSSKKDHVTGYWNTRRDENVEIYFKCRRSKAKQTPK